MRGVEFFFGKEGECFFSSLFYLSASSCFLSASLSHLLSTHRRSLLFRRHTLERNVELRVTEFRENLAREGKKNEKKRVSLL